MGQFLHNFVEGPSLLLVRIDEKAPDAQQVQIYKGNI